MSRKLLLINLLMASAIAAVGFHLVSSWKAFHRDNPIAARLANPLSGGMEEAMPVTFDAPVYADYLVIAERNLFSPDRRPYQEDAGDGQNLRPPDWHNKPPLYHGSYVVGGERTGIVTEFAGRASRGTRKEIGLGDIVQGWEVSAIERDNFTLKWNDQETVIEKTEQAVPQRQTRQVAASSVTIIRIGSAGPAVDTTTPTQDDTEEAKLTVSTAGDAQGQRGGLQGRGRSGLQNPNRNPNARNNRTLGTGVGGGQRSVIPRNPNNQGNRPPR